MIARGAGRPSESAAATRLGGPGRDLLPDGHPAPAPRQQRWRNPADPARVTRTTTWRSNVSESTPRTLIDP